MNGAKYRIGGSLIIKLIFFSVIFDLLSLIPFVGDFVGPIFWCITGYILFKKGVNIIKGSELAASAISFIAKLIPIIQEFPELTAGLIAIIIITRLEDKTGIQIPLSGKGVGKLIKNKKTDDNEDKPPQSLNESGIRRPIERPGPLNAEGTREPRRNMDIAPIPSSANEEYPLAG